jgi:hypothetical protein
MRGAKTPPSIQLYIKDGIGEIGWEFVEWIHLAQNRYQWQGLVKMVMNFRVS